MPRKNLEWTPYFRRMAETAALKSKDERAQVGAIIVGPDREIVSTGYNSFPRGLNDDIPERQERPEKYYWMEHAERNAIYNAARHGTPTRGCTLYLSHWFPCHECARAIINSGIKEIYCDPLEKSIGSSSFDESFKRSYEMLMEAGIKINYYKVGKK